MSGGSAKSPTDEMSRASEKAPADSEEDDTRQEFCTVLMFGFWSLLEEVFPYRYSLTEEYPFPTIDQVLVDIEHLTGCKMMKMYTSIPASYKQRKLAFEAFRAEHKMPLDAICFHGSSPEAVMAIHNDGFDPTLVKRELYGSGAYISTHLLIALTYSQRDENGELWVVFGRAHIGYPDDIPVGSEGQTDFGVRKDGTRIFTSTDPSRKIFCLGQPQQQFISNGYIRFSIRTDEKPSDFALCNVIYPQVVWEEMKQRIPGLVAYKQRLLKEETRKKRKARRTAAWTTQVGIRKQPSRAAKR